MVRQPVARIQLLGIRSNRALVPSGACGLPVLDSCSPRRPASRELTSISAAILNLARQKLGPSRSSMTCPPTQSFPNPGPAGTLLCALLLQPAATGPAAWKCTTAGDSLL